MRVSEELRKCVAFVGVNAASKGVKFGGTGFLVAMPTESDPTYQAFYFVTAKHVAEAIKKYGGCFLRLNRQDGSSSLFNMPSDGWWYHPSDTTADVAMASFPALSTAEYDYRVIPASMFVTPHLTTERGIGIGDEVVASGLFVHLTGTARNVPIIRTGVIAMMPEEKIVTQDCPAGMDGYLIESRSIGGLSGSPVFVRQSVNVNIGAPQQFTASALDIFLLGLVHGHWNLPPYEAEHALGALYVDFQTMNMGISIVVPATKILETLQRSELVSMRTEAIKQVETQTTVQASEPGKTG